MLAHNMRRPEEFEAYSGGTLWINQGGEVGKFFTRLSDIEGGGDSTTADQDGDGDPDLLVYDGFRLTLGWISI